MVRLRRTFQYIRRVHAYKLFHLIRTAVPRYGWDDTFHTGVHPRRVDAHSCTAHITTDVQLCGRCDVCRTPVHSDSFAMRSSTYDLAGSGLTFEIMRFGSNTGRDFNYHLPEAQSNPQIPSSRWTTLCRDKNLDRPRGSPLKLFTARLSQVIRLAHGFALASPRDRTCN